MKKIKAPEGGGADWMGTYGDMVTLLLCFFVLLYSISSVDQAKWENLVKSMNPNASEVSQIVSDTQLTPGEDDVPGGAPDATSEQFDQMAQALQDVAASMGIESNVEITKGEGYAFISFRDEVFFDGDSYIIKGQGQAILDGFAGAIAPASDSIKEIQVLGHTTQADPHVVNEVVGDRMLAAERSAQVVSYLQMKNVVEPSKLVSAAYGQYRPIDSFATEESRSRNRRAEILITKTGSAEQSLATYYEEVYGQTEQE